jgi:mannose/fructose/N-acetylgalactosamine-specific phosphotransferase system component IID
MNFRILGIILHCWCLCNCEGKLGDSLFCLELRSLFNGILNGVNYGVHGKKFGKQLFFLTAGVFITERNNWYEFQISARSY